MPDNLQQRIAAELRAELARQQVTQKRLAIALGLSEAQTSERLLGRVPMRPAEIEKAAAFLNIPVGTFLAAATS